MSTQCSCEKPFPWTQKMRIGSECYATARTTSGSDFRHFFIGADFSRDSWMGANLGTMHGKIQDAINSKAIDRQGPASHGYDPGQISFSGRREEQLLVKCICK